MEHTDIPIAQPAPQEPPRPNSAASARATVTLLLGVLAILCMGFLTGIPAIVTGQMELKAIKAGQSPGAGENLARVGFILGIVGTVLSCLAMLAFAALMAFGISMGAGGLQEMAQPI